MTQSILTNRQELEAWLDDFMSEQMSKLHIPGATFSLVQNGELFFAKGYGYANLEQQIPVSAERTLFRVGSISKLFNATAIMQLVEKGLLNLDDDVNKYLQDFQLEDNYPQPVTIANLLTHTAGFDDRLVGLFTLDINNIEPLGEHLTAKMPARVMPPGEVMSYSNYGYALLGYIVESVAGMLFSQYVDEHVLQPLEMHHSSFAQPPHSAGDVSIGYQYKKKQETHQALPFHYVQIPPAGSLSATATDMAKFAIAHLQYGQYKSSRILKETTARQMQQQQFTHDPRLPGMCWGFRESLCNKQRGIIHGGGLPGFISLLYLLPSHNLGFFVSDNGQGNLAGKLLEEFGDRYFPTEQNTNSYKPSLEDRKSLKRYQGNYRYNRYARRTFDKINLLGFSPLRLKAEADGTLSIPQTLKTPEPKYLQEIEPSLLQLQVKEKERPDTRFVAKEQNGKITALLTNNGVFEKLSWYETKTFHWTLVWTFIVIFLSGSIVGILALTKFPETSGHQLAQSLAVITCGLNLIFFVGMLIVQQLVRNNYRLQLIYGVPRIVTILLCLPILTSVLAIPLLIFAILTLTNPEWSAMEQLHYCLVSFTAIGFIPFLNYWNLLGFRY